jgi:hypothetical protein
MKVMPTDRVLAVDFSTTRTFLRYLKVNMA